MTILDKLNELLKEKEEHLLLLEKHTRECDMGFIRDYASAYTMLNSQVELLREIVNEHYSEV